MKKFFAIFVLSISVLTLTACSGEGLLSQEDGIATTTITTTKSVFFVEQVVERKVKDLSYIREIETEQEVVGGRYITTVTMRTRASEWGNAEVQRTDAGYWQYTFRANSREELETITLVYRTANTPIWYALAGVVAVLVGVGIYLYQKRNTKYKIQNTN